MWVARDKCGELYLYAVKPYKDVDNEAWFCKEHGAYSQILCEQSDIINDFFIEVKWEDEEPTEVEIKIKNK